MPAAQDPKQSWQPGSVIAGLYEVKELIGRGGMGAVHRVFDLKWQMDLAIKTPNEAALARAGGRERFQEREAYEWVRLGMHPNIVTCFYVRKLDDGIPRVFIEYVGGGSLADWIEQDKVTDLRTALDIAIQICWGLGWAHKFDLVHRDVTPANILMTLDGTPKVTDFGLIKPVGEAHSGVLAETQTEAAPDSTTHMGTPGYVAPEQGRRGAVITSAADIYSIGIVLYKLLHRPLGLDPFSNAHPNARPALYQIVLKQRKDVLSEVFARCMASNPSERYPNGLSLAETLIKTYEAVVGEAYTREPPDEIKALANGLNNLALSLLDLGKQDEAEAAWAEALEVDPNHSEATYNRGIAHWRRGELTDDVLIQQLESARANHGGAWLDAYLLGLVHLERGDAEAAMLVLAEAARTVPSDMEVRSALEAARTLEGPDRCHVLEGHQGPATAVTLTADGRFAVSGGGSILSPQKVFMGVDTPLRLWDLVTGQCLRTFEGHTGWIKTVAFTPVGRFVISGSSDGTIRLWDRAAGQCLHILHGHTREVLSVALTPDARYAISGSSDQTLRFWEPTTAQCLRILEGHTGPVKAVALTPDARYALSGSSDQTLRLWEPTTGQCLRTIDEEVGHVLSIALTEDAHFALVGSEDRILRLWELTTGRRLRTLEGHKGWIWSVAMTPDGRFAVSASMDKTVRVWQLGLQRHNRSPLVYTRPRETIALSQEAQMVQQALENVSGLLRDGRFREAAIELRVVRKMADYERQPEILGVWHHAGRGGRRSTLLGIWHIHTLEYPVDPATSVPLRREGRLNLSESDEPFRQMWEVIMGRHLQFRKGFGDGDISVAHTPDGRFAISGGKDRKLRLWELATGECMRTFEGHDDWIWWVAVTSDGRFALSASGDRTLRLWELATGQCRRIFEGHTNVISSVALTADGRFAISGSFDMTLRLWEVASGRCLRTEESYHTEGVGAVALSPDGRFALSGGVDKDRTVRLWELDWDYEFPAPADWDEGARPYVESFLIRRIADGGARQQTHEPHEENTQRTRSLHTKPAWTEQDFQALVQQLQYAGFGWLRPESVRKELERMTHDWKGSPLPPGGKSSASGIPAELRQRTFKTPMGPVYSVSLSADGRLALSGSTDRTIRLWDTASGQCLHIFEGHTGTVRAVCLSRDGRYALSGGSDNTLKLWDLASGHCLRTFQGHKSWVNSVSMSADNRWALSGSGGLGGGDNTLRLWEVATGRCLRVFQGHTRDVRSVCLSADERVVLSGSQDSTLRLWEIATGRCLRVFRGHTNWVNSGCLSADSRWALSGSGGIGREDNSLRVWEVETGNCQKTCVWPSGVWSISLSSDGCYVLVGTKEGTLHLWEVATGLWQTFKERVGWVHSVCLSADGHWAFAGSDGGPLRLWELDRKIETHDPADWDEGARPYLRNFLTRHTPYAAPLPQDRQPSEKEIRLALTRRGPAVWNEDDFQALLQQLQYAGYDWLRPEGVRKELAHMARKWKRLPPLFPVAM